MSGSRFHLYLPRQDERLSALTASTTYLRSPFPPYSVNINHADTPNPVLKIIPSEYPEFYNMFESESIVYGRQSANGQFSRMNKFSKEVKFEELFSDEEKRSLNQIVPSEVTSYIKSEVADQIEAISEAFNDDLGNFDDFSKNNVMRLWSDISFKLDDDGLCKLKIKSEPKIKAEPKDKGKPRKYVKKVKESKVKLSPTVSQKNEGSGLKLKCKLPKEPLPKLCINNNQAHEKNKTMDNKKDMKREGEHKPQYYSCKYQSCWFAFANLKHLLKHYVDTHGGALFACPSCPFMTVNRQVLWQHHTAQHGSDNQQSRTNSHKNEEKLDGQPFPKSKFKFRLKLHSKEKSKTQAIKKVLSLHQFPNRANAVSLLLTKNKNMCEMGNNNKVGSIAFKLNNNVKISDKNVLRNASKPNKQAGHVFSPQTKTINSQIQIDTLSPKNPAVQNKKLDPMKENQVVQVDNSNHSEKVLPLLDQDVRIDSLPLTKEAVQVGSLPSVEDESSSDVGTDVDLHNNPIFPDLENDPRNFQSRLRRIECKEGLATLKEIVPELSKMTKPTRLTILTKANQYVHLLREEHDRQMKEIIMEAQRNQKLKKIIAQMNN